MSQPLYELKAEFFTLAEPLSECNHSVAELVPAVGIEPAHLSGQLAVLRRANLVVSRKDRSTVSYSITSPHIADLLAAARSILTGVLSEQAELLQNLRAFTPGARL